MIFDRENCRSNPPPPHIFADRLPPHLSCNFFHFETYVPKPAKGLVCGVGVQKSKNSSLMKTSTKCVFLYVREELAKNFTQTKKSKKCWVKCSQSGQRPRVGGGCPEIQEFFANEESEEMRFSPRTRRTRKEFHANEEIGETLCHMFPSWPKGRS